MGDVILRVEKLANGYECEICDPDIMAANDKPKAAYKSPWKDYAFTTAAEVIAFITEHLDKLKPPPDADAEYSAAFDSATQEEE